MVDRTPMLTYICIVNITYCWSISIWYILLEYKHIVNVLKFVCEAIQSKLKAKQLNKLNIELFQHSKQIRNDGHLDYLQKYISHIRTPDISVIQFYT